MHKTWDNITQRQSVRGFIPDLIAKLCKRMRMSCKIELLSHGGYGSMKEDGTWTGLIRDIIEGVSTYDMSELWLLYFYIRF